MLIRFTVENFLSFKERQSFSMIAGKGGRDKKFHLIEKKNRNDVNLVKTGLIFGPNASGKSNLVKAIDFGKELILRGTAPDKQISYNPFRLDKESQSSPIRIEYEIKHKGKSYAYGFVFNRHSIIEEWLYEIDKKKEAKIFERGNTVDFDIEPLLEKNSQEAQQTLKSIAKLTPDNQLFLTDIRQRKVKENVSDIEDLLNVIDWFQNALTILYPDSRVEGIEFELDRNSHIANIFEEVLKYFDTGIDGIELVEVDFEKIAIPKQIKEDIKSNLLADKTEKTNAWAEDRLENIRYIFSRENDDKVSVRKLMTKHKVQKGDSTYFDVNEESDGTQRIMDFIPVLIDLFKGENVFIVDEMERSLHPNLIYDFIDLFLTETEGINSQLLMASHESSLLTQKLLRKDEVWFCVKNENRSSSVYSLEEFDIRFDKQIRKDYLLGRYKAIPRLGNRQKLSILK